VGTRSAGHDGAEAIAEALIKEARRLHRLRWQRRGALAIVAAVVAASIFALTQGGGPPKPHHQVIRPGSPTTRHLVDPSLGPATSYQLTGPVGVALDGSGNVYFTDGNRVLKIDHTTQQLLVVAGTGASGFSGNGGRALRATLTAPSGITVDSHGNVYFVANNRILKVSTTTGIISTIAGTGRIGSGGNGGPAIRASLNLESSGTGAVGLNDSLAIGPHGNLYIADGGNNEIRKVSLATGVISRVAGDGHFGSSADGTIATKTALCGPVGIAVDGSSNVFFSDACGAVREVSHSSGLVSTIFSSQEDPMLTGSGGDHDPVGLATSGNGKLFVSEMEGRRLLEINLGTRQVTLLAGTGVQTIPTANGTAGDGGPASNATFGLPLGVAVDRHGDIFVADFFNNAVRMINAQTGMISTVAGRIPMSPAQGHCC
jgi:streptogramin lyase